MEELIRRSDAIKSLMQYAEGKKTIRQCIEECPSVPQEPKTDCDNCDYKEWLKGEMEANNV